MKDRNAKKIGKILGINYWVTNDVISQYYKDGGLIVKSKL